MFVRVCVYVYTHTQRLPSEDGLAAGKDVDV